MDMKKIKREAAKAVERAGGTSSLKSEEQGANPAPGRGAGRSSAAALFKGPAKSGAGGKRSQHR